MIVKRNETEARQILPGLTRRILNHGGKLMMTEFVFKKDTDVDVHSHPHEQISCCIQGSGKFHLDGIDTIVEKGDSVYIPPDVPHGFMALEEGTIMIDAFSPIREDFLK